MSFILEALKRADRERTRGRAPDVTTAYHEAAAPRRRLWPWLVLGGALLVNALILAVIFWPQAIEAPPGHASDPDRATVTSHLARGNRPVADPVARPAPSARATADRREADFRASVEAVSSAPKAADSGPVLESGRLHREVRPREEPAGVGAGGRFATASGAGRDPALETTAPAGDSSEAAVATEEAAPAEAASPRPPEGSQAAPAPPPPAGQTPYRDQGEQIPLLSELPHKERQTLQGLRIDGHVYTEDAARRFVFIGMRSYRAGDRIGKDGPLLERITPDGVIVDYGAGRAKLLTER
jgi:hypothetical protein